MRIVYFIKKSLFRFGESLIYCFFRILRKTALHYHIRVKIITKKISTKAATVTIVNSEVWTSWPLFRINISPVLWRKKICYDRNSVLIIITNKALICICSIGSYYSSALVWCFSWIIIGYYDFVCRLNSDLVKIFLCGTRSLYIAFTSWSHTHRLVWYKHLCGFLHLSIASWVCSIEILGWWRTLTHTSCLSNLKLVNFRCWFSIFSIFLFNIFKFELSVLSSHLNFRLRLVSCRVALKLVQEDILAWRALSQMSPWLYSTMRNFHAIFMFLLSTWCKIFLTSSQFISFRRFFWYRYLEVLFSSGCHRDLRSYSYFEDALL